MRVNKAQKPQHERLWPFSWCGDFDPTLFHILQAKKIKHFVTCKGQASTPHEYRTANR